MYGPKLEATGGGMLVLGLYTQRPLIIALAAITIVITAISFLRLKIGEKRIH